MNKESLGESYINQVIDKRHEEANRRALRAKPNQNKVINEAIYYMKLAHDPTPEDSPESIIWPDNTSHEEYNYKK